MVLLHLIWLAVTASALCAMLVLAGLIVVRATHGNRERTVAQVRLGVLAALMSQTLDEAKFRASLEAAARLRILAELVLEVTAIVQGPLLEAFVTRLHRAGALGLLSTATTSRDPIHCAHAKAAAVEICAVSVAGGGGEGSFARQRAFMHGRSAAMLAPTHWHFA